MELDGLSAYKKDEDLLCNCIILKTSICCFTALKDLNLSNNMFSELPKGKVYSINHLFMFIERFSIECRKKLTNSFGFALLHSVIGSKFSRHFFNQS